MLVSVFGPTMVTGSDPTTIPLAAMIAPVVAMLATVAAGIVAVVANGLSRPPRSIWWSHRSRDVVSHLWRYRG